MIVSCYTAGDSALSRVRTHNAGVAGSSPAPAMELDDFRGTGGARNGPNGPRFSLSAKSIVTLALASQGAR